MLVNIRMSSNNNPTNEAANNSILAATKPDIKTTGNTIVEIAKTLTTPTGKSNNSNDPDKIKNVLIKLIKEDENIKKSLTGPQGPEGLQGPEGPAGKDGSVSPEYLKNMILTLLDDVDVKNKIIALLSTTEIKKLMQDSIPTKESLTEMIKQIIADPTIRESLRGNKGNAGEKGNNGKKGNKGNSGNSTVNRVKPNIKPAPLSSTNPIASNNNTTRKRLSPPSAISQLRADEPKNPELAPTNISVTTRSDNNNLTRSKKINSSARKLNAESAPAEPVVEPIGPSSENPVNNTNTKAATTKTTATGPSSATIQLPKLEKKSSKKPRTLGELLKSNPGEYEALAKEYQGLPNNQKPNSFINFFKTKYGVTNNTTQKGGRSRRKTKTIKRRR